MSTDPKQPKIVDEAVELVEDQLDDVAGGIAIFASKVSDISYKTGDLQFNKAGIAVQNDLYLKIGSDLAKK